MQPKEPIRLVALDLDGTVFRSDKTISPATVEAIGKAVEQGVVVLPVTGRPLKGVPPEILALPGVEFVISANGTKLFRLSDGACLYENLLPPGKALEVLEALRGYPVYPDFFVDGRGNASTQAKKNLPHMGIHPYMVEYLLSGSRVFHDDLEAFVKAQEGNIEKVTVHLHVLPDGTRKMGEEVMATLRQIEGIQAVTGAPHNFEVMGETAGKGTALLHLASLLHIPRECVMAIGDEENDLDMLKKAGFSVAMGNAKDTVKAVADVVTDTNDNDGVAKAFWQYVIRNE